jgi:hypothetical protein
MFGFMQQVPPSQRMNLEHADAPPSTEGSQVSHYLHICIQNANMEYYQPPVTFSFLQQLPAYQRVRSGNAADTPPHVSTHPLTQCI